MNEPKLRFPEFTDDWKQHKLGELGSLKNGMNFSKEAMGIGFPFVNLQNIFGNNVVDVSNLGKAMASESQLKDYNLINGDVLFVRSSVKLEGVGEAAVIPCTLKDTTYSGFIIRFRDEYGLDNDFKRFVFGIESVRNQIMSQATNSANKNISQPVLENLKLAIPSKLEQQKLGVLFSNLDTLIQSAEKELDGYRELKQGMLQKMFPKKGETTPEIRFPEFTGDWEKRKLEDIANRFDNLRVPVASSLRIKGTTPYYGANGIQDYVDGFTHEGEYVLVAEDGANDLINYPVNYVNGRIWVNNHAHVLQGKDNVVNNRYLSYAISRVNMQSVLVGGGRAKLNAEVMMNLDLFLPSIAEQKKIGEYFSNLDSLITLQQQELDGYKELKKGLLQQMFC